MFKNTMKEIRALCTPASLYFALSMILLVITIIQNFGNTDKYCLGKLSCYVGNTVSVFVMKTLFIAFWTWLISVFCKAGYEAIAWSLFIIPYLIFIMIIGMVMIALK